MDCNTINELWELDARRMDYRRAADYHRRKRHQAGFQVLQLLFHFLGSLLFISRAQVARGLMVSSAAAMPSA